MDISIVNNDSRFSSNLDVSSDEYLLKEFFKEYSGMMYYHKEQGLDLYLLDALRMLHFLDDNFSQSDQYGSPHRFAGISRSKKFNIMILCDCDDGYSDDLEDNLFTICCALQGLGPDTAGVALDTDALD